MYLIINAGSSSVKFSVFSMELNEWASGIVDGIGLLRCELNMQVHKLPVHRKTRIANHRDAIGLILAELKSYGLHDADIVAAGHRVVHGGKEFVTTCRVTPSVVAQIRRLCSLAPLHNPHNLTGILAAQSLLPGTPQVVAFDTSFHTTMPEHAYLYALPYALYEKKGIRKFGFHGISYKYVSEQVPKVLGRKAARLIICHLGNGASVCAIKNGHSMDTSMGFTPLDGLVMGTRSGSVDPGLLLHLLGQGFSSKSLGKLLLYDSGLKGLGGAADVRDLQNLVGVNATQRNRAFATYTYRLAGFIGQYATMLGGLDALVFTAGAGEKAWYLREDTCKQLSAWGIKLDAGKNKTNALKISSPASQVPVLVIPTNEALQIATEMKALLGAHAKSSPVSSRRGKRKRMKS